MVVVRELCHSCDYFPDSHETFCKTNTNELKTKQHKTVTSSSKHDLHNDLKIFSFSKRTQKNLSHKINK